MWARDGLRRRGLTPFEVLTTPMLGPSQLWDHRIGESGASVAVGVTATRRVDGGRVKGVLNRLTWVPHWPPLEAAAVRDRGFAAHEIAAFFVSWLSALPRPMLHPPTPRGLSGGGRRTGAW